MKHAVTKLTIDFQSIGEEIITLPIEEDELNSINFHYVHKNQLHFPWVKHPRCGYIVKDIPDHVAAYLSTLLEYSFKCANIHLKKIDIDYIPIGVVEETVTCRHCGTEIPKQFAIESDLYDTPWDNSTDGDYFCSLFCRECTYGNIYSKDFNYFHCEICGRNICEQNPSNGWHSQIRRDGDIPVCLKCYEENRIENGEPYDTLKDIKETGVPGMFYNEHELKEHGYVEYPDAYFLPDSMEHFQERLNILMSLNKKILIAYDRMAIGGIEGTVTIFTKNKEEVQTDEQ